MKKTVFLTLAALVVATAMFTIGCSEDRISSPTSTASQDLVFVSSADSCVTLLAGQTIPAGTFCITVDNPNNCVNVTYTTTNGWELVETHLWAGLTVSGWPQTNKGNPIPGQFPYASGNITGATSWSTCIPLSVFGLSSTDTLCNVTAYFAAHAAVRKLNSDGSYQNETAWGQGIRMQQRGNWATYFSFTFGCDAENNEGRAETCETAFAFGGDNATCFLDMGMGFNRWGWTNGPLAPGSYTFDIYAGAGQCDLTKGTEVGSLTVVYANGTATVTYNMDSGFWMDEAQLYVGSEVVPRDVNGDFTVAPGQYPQNHDLTHAGTDTFTFTGLSGSIYVVAHAVVCSNNW